MKPDFDEFIAEKSWLAFIPDYITVTITIDTVINPTEDKEKVIKAARIIFDNITGFPCKIDGDAALNVLDVINRKIEQQQIMDAARKHLLDNLTYDAGTTVMFINKQVALHGRLNFSEEAPLGPIVVLIQSNRIDQIINHFFPKAEWKYPKKRKKKKRRRDKSVSKNDLIEEIPVEDIDPGDYELED